MGVCFCGLWSSDSLIVVLLVVLIHCLSTVAQDDPFDTTVTIQPSKANKNDNVTFTCEFNILSLEKDLSILYWETAAGGTRIYQLNNEIIPFEETKHSPYDAPGKIVETRYENVTELTRRHTLVMTVTNCDRATYKCMVFNKQDYSEGNAKQALEIEPNLPVPDITVEPVDAMETDGCPKDKGYYCAAPLNTTKLVVKCAVKGVSVQPDMTITRNGDTLTDTILDREELQYCLHDGAVESPAQTINKTGGEGTVFKCEVNYGGTRESSSMTVTFEDEGARTGSSTGASVGIAVGVIVPIVIIAIIVIIVIILMRRRSRRRHKQLPPPDKNNLRVAAPQQEPDDTHGEGVCSQCFQAVLNPN